MNSDGGQKAEDSDGGQKAKDWDGIEDSDGGQKCCGRIWLDGKRMEKENGSFKMRQSFDIDCGSAIF